MGKKKYKSIVVSDLTDEICVFHMVDCAFKGLELYIFGIAEFAEYIGYKKPKYVIIDKKGIETQQPKELNDYLKKHGVDDLIKYGVKKIYFIVNEDRYPELKDIIGYKGIKAFPNYESCLKEIGKELGLLN